MRPTYQFPPATRSPNLFLSLQVEMASLGSSSCVSQPRPDILRKMAFFLMYQDIFVMRYTEMKKSW